MNKKILILPLVMVVSSCNPASYRSYYNKNIFDKIMDQFDTRQAPGALLEGDFLNIFTDGISTKTNKITNNTYRFTLDEFKDDYLLLYFKDVPKEIDRSMISGSLIQEYVYHENNYLPEYKFYNVNNLSSIVDIIDDYSLMLVLGKYNINLKYNFSKNIKEEAQILTYAPLKGKFIDDKFSLIKDEFNYSINDQYVGTFEKEFIDKRYYYDSNYLFKRNVYDSSCTYFKIYEYQDEEVLIMPRYLKKFLSDELIDALDENSKFLPDNVDYFGKYKNEYKKAYLDSADKLGLDKNDGIYSLKIINEFIHLG